MKHRIILLNFSKRDADIVAKEGYNIERGHIGSPAATVKYLPFYSPHPLFEYDVLFYNSSVPQDLKDEIKTKTLYNLYEQSGSHDALRSFRTPPYIRISFIGDPIGGSLIQGGAPFVKISTAEENVSSLVTYTGSIYSIEKLHTLLIRYKSEVSSIGQFFDIPKDPYPLILVPVLGSRSKELVSGYITEYRSKNILRCIILPQLKNIPKAVVEILECLEEIVPELFADKVRRNWLETDEFLLPEERKIQIEIQKKISEATTFIDDKKKKKEEIAKNNAFVRGLLVATEDNEDPEMRLSNVVKKALEFLEFKVEDIDQKTKSIIKKEDFWVTDRGYFAITEVSGTKNKNPKVKEFNDIFARIATIYKRKGDLVLPEGVPICGLLILNYDIDNHPSKRPKLYKGEDDHIVDTARDQCIGLLSTVELHKIITAVVEGSISKKDAREIVKQFGRIEIEGDN